VKLVLALSSLLFLSGAIAVSESPLLVRLGFLALAIAGAVWSVIRYQQERRGETQ
jgi:hypothetical protein